MQSSWPRIATRNVESNSELLIINPTNRTKDTTKTAQSAEGPETHLVGEL